MHRNLTILTATMALSACTPSYDEALLDEYRGALPSNDTLSARSPASGTFALGETAVYPSESAGLVHGINGAVGSIVDGLGAIVEQPPTLYDGTTEEFVWGPWADETHGSVAVYIKRQGSEADFEYVYALLRGPDNAELGAMTPIIIGGATPDPDDDDHGEGVTLWDFDANNEFLESQGMPTESEGRFIAAYGRDIGDDGNEAAMVVASFRDFVSEDDLDAAPGDLDYFYGRVWDQHTIDFLDYRGTFDVSDPTDDVPEDVEVRMAFVDEGIGRAEANAVGGSLYEDQIVLVDECWNEAVAQTYLNATLLDGDSTQKMYQVGDVTDCSDPFQSTLDELAVPSLDDVDPALLEALDAWANSGIE